MAKIGFIGLGHMGGPMSRNLVKAGHTVQGFDLSDEAINAAEKAGVFCVKNPFEAANNADYVITMLPEGRHVQDIYLGKEGLIKRLVVPSFFIDCSTIDVQTSRTVAGEAARAGHKMLDAPVSGGVTGAENATLTFMVGGTNEHLDSAKFLFDVMGKNIFHCGGVGNGQVAKICNNMMLAIQMVSVAEGFRLAEGLGLEAQVLFDVVSQSSGQCWSLTSYCPAPGPVPTSPANKDYQAGFAAAMMLKDLNLSHKATEMCHLSLPLSERVRHLYDIFCKDSHNAKLDFSGIIKSLR